MVNIPDENDLGSMTPLGQLLQDKGVREYASKDGCELQELAVFPQGTLSTAQGLTGVRKWYLSGRANLQEHLQQICDSHWPGNADCRPSSIQWGAADDKVVVTGNVKNISAKLARFDQYLIVAQYDLLHISDKWPITGKPAHPLGTTLTLQVRGGAEILEIDPSALTDGGRGKGKGATGCFVDAREIVPGTVFNSRIQISHTEYHITCDRLTDTQLCRMMQKGKHYVGWKIREGTVNSDPYVNPNARERFDGRAVINHGAFMNELEGTLLFDSWTLDQSFVPDTKNPKRWKIGCVLKCRQVPDVKGPYPDNCGKPSWAVGWNHDYKRSIQRSQDMGWQFIMLECATGLKETGWTPHGSCPEGFVPRYPYMPFADMFCDEARFKCDNSSPPKCHGSDNDQAEGSAGGGSDGGGSGGGVGSLTAEEIIEQVEYDARGVSKRKEEREQRLLGQD